MNSLPPQIEILFLFIEDLPIPSQSIRRGIRPNLCSTPLCWPIPTIWRRFVSLASVLVKINEKKILPQKSWDRWLAKSDTERSNHTRERNWNVVPESVEELNRGGGGGHKIRSLEFFRLNKAFSSLEEEADFTYVAWLGSVWKAPFLPSSAQLPLKTLIPA